MLSLRYFLGDDTVDLVADAGVVVASFHTALRHTRGHVVAAMRGDDDVWYHFHVGALLLLATLDGLAVYVEKKVQDPPARGTVHWHTAFVDPRFSALRAIRDRTSGYIIKGGIDVHALRNLARHYLPWAGVDTRCDTRCDTRSDIMFLAGAEQKSGPVLRGLLVPLFNDACAAVQELGALIGQPAPHVHAL